MDSYVLIEDPEKILDSLGPIRFKAEIYNITRQEERKYNPRTLKGWDPNFLQRIMPEILQALFYRKTHRYSCQLIPIGCKEGNRLNIVGSFIPRHEDQRDLTEKLKGIHCNIGVEVTVFGQMHQSYDRTYERAMQIDRVTAESKSLNFRGIESRF